MPFGCEADVILPYAPEDLSAKDNNVLFAKVQDGVCHVGPGHYEVSYETTKPLRKVYSCDTPIVELLASPNVVAAIQQVSPQFMEIPEQYRMASIRQLAAHIPGMITEDQMEQFDRLLAGVE